MRYLKRFARRLFFYVTARLVRLRIRVAFVPFVSCVGFLNLHQGDFSHNAQRRYMRGKRKLKHNYMEFGIMDRDAAQAPYTRFGRVSAVRFKSLGLCACAGYLGPLRTKDHTASLFVRVCGCFLFCGSYYQSHARSLLAFTANVLTIFQVRK